MNRKLFFILGMAFVFLVACGREGGGTISPQEQSFVRLQLGRNQVPGLDSVVVGVSGSEMAPLHFAYNEFTPQLVLEDIPPGPDRRFVVQVYASGGVLVQQGESVADILSGETVNLTVALQALVGFLHIHVPLGLNNEWGIVSGELQVLDEGGDTFVYSMTLGEGFGAFETTALPLNNPLLVQLKLHDASGSTLFTGERTVVLANIVQNEELTLRSTRGTAAITIQLASMEPLQILANLPVSSKRAPMAANEMLFTEIFAYPKTGGDDYEYLEIYNTTLDTLHLQGCSIGRSRSSSGATSVFALSEAVSVAPMEYYVLGRDSADLADEHYSSFVLSNSGQSLVLFCGDLVLDSLSYLPASDAENPFPLSMGVSMQLPIAQWKQRHQGSSWCSGTQSYTSGSLTFKGSPGAAAICE